MPLPNANAEPGHTDGNPAREKSQSEVPQTAPPSAQLHRTSPWEIVHELPGRLRLKSTNMLTDRELVASLLNHLSSIAGVTGARYNHWNYSLVIEHEGLDCDFLLTTLSHKSLYTKVEGQLITLPLAEKPERRLNRWLKAFLDTVDRLIPSSLQAMLGAGALVAGWLKAPSLVVGSLLGGSLLSIGSRAVRTVCEEERLGVDALDLAAASLMVARGRYIEAGFMAALIGLGEYIRDLTAGKCKQMVTDLLGMAGRSAWLVKGRKRLCVPADQLVTGNVVVVYPGEMIPADGMIIDGKALIDQSMLTGESLPVEVAQGSEVFSSTMLMEGKIYLRVTATGGDTQAGKVLSSVMNAPLHETKIQNYATLMADKMVVPILLGSAACLAITRDPVRAMTMLVFDFSTAIRISAPTAVLASMYRVGRHGILIKNGAALERLSTINAVIFDKTGTLTAGEPSVTTVTSFNGHSERELIELAASVEQRSKHPAARAITKYCLAQNIVIPDREDSEILNGLGAKATVKGKSVLVGSRLFLDSQGIDCLAGDNPAWTAKVLSTAGTSSQALVAINGKLAGLIEYRDSIRPEARAALTKLRRLGVKRVAMATGDNAQAAERTASKLGISETLSGVFPTEKADFVKALKKEGLHVAVIGDGINDSPALSHADVAVSLHGATEIARHCADVVLTDDNLIRLPEAIRAARSTIGLVKQNLFFSVIPNIGGLGLAAFGLIGPAMATVLNNGSAILAALNSLRPLYSNQWSKVEIVPGEETGT